MIPYARTLQPLWDDYRRGVPDGLVPDHGTGKVERLLASLSVPTVSVRGHIGESGADRRDLYIVSADNTDDASLGGSIFSTRVDVAGLAVAPARV